MCASYRCFAVQVEGADGILPTNRSCVPSTTAFPFSHDDLAGDADVLITSIKEPKLRATCCWL